MKKHTPGPWVASHSMNLAKGSSKTCVYANEGLKLIASTARGFNSEIAEANACLIAAAPELLSSLKEIVEQEELLASHEGSKTRKTEANEKIKRAWDAIAKAEGTE